ncbi:MAG: hypothetical protein M3364_09105 [Actinomycetota bacterium]|nr:hypothetical protein [Actinomycetota bacterium]
MYAAAPRLDPRLLAAIKRLDDSSVPIAETYRRCRGAAMELGIPRPSYERVRLHVRQIRRERERARVARETILDVLLNQRPLDALNEIL